MDVYFVLNENNLVIDAVASPELAAGKTTVLIEDQDIINQVTSKSRYSLFFYVDGVLTENENPPVPVVVADPFTIRAKKREFGLKVIDEIAVMNDGKNLTHDQVDAFMVNPIIINLKAHLEAGNIDTFIYKLENADVSEFFSAEEKAAVIEKCNAFVASL